MPASIAASTTAFVCASSIRIPKLLHPTPTTETSRSPSLRISIRVPPPRSSACVRCYPATDERRVTYRLRRDRGRGGLRRLHRRRARRRPPRGDPRALQVLPPQPP